MLEQNRLLRLGILLCFFFLIIIGLQWTFWFLQRRKKRSEDNLFCCRDAFRGICFSTIFDMIGLSAFVTLFIFMQKGWFQINATITFRILGIAVIFLFIGSVYWYRYFSLCIHYDAVKITITYSFLTNKSIFWSDIKKITYHNTICHPASLRIEVKDGSFLYMRTNWVGFKNFELMAKTKNLLS